MEKVYILRVKAKRRFKDSDIIDALTGPEDFQSDFFKGVGVESLSLHTIPKKEWLYPSYLKKEVTDGG